MKNPSPARSGSCLHLCLPIIIGLFLGVTGAHAGLTFTVDLLAGGGSYKFYTPMDTNALAPAAPFGFYIISSPGQPTNGSWRHFSYDASGFNTISGGEQPYTNLSAVLQEITNGNWTIQFTNATVTNYYTFRVSLPGGLSTNQLPATSITFPVNGANNLTNMPTFVWHGQPTNWPVAGSLYVYQSRYDSSSSFYYPSAASGSQTNWTIPVAIPASNPGSYTYLNLGYVTNYAGDLFVATTPLKTNNAQPIAGWAYHSTLESGDNVAFTVAPPPASSVAQRLIAHYAFDSGGLFLDSSANANHIECSGCAGACTMFQFTTDAQAGDGAAQFFGESWMTPCHAAFTNWTNALSGSFTVSAWIKTSNVLGNDNDALSDWDGQNVIYLNNNGNGLIPLGITGTKAAIATGVPPGAYGQDTLNSVATVTSGSYVHVVVTRDQGSGLKQIYINGVLDSSDYGEPGILDGGADWASIGGEGSGPFTGLLDDVQIYSGVLGSDQIAFLYDNPGQTASSSDFNLALGTTGLTWTTEGDTRWFVETANTYNGAPAAAQSGSVANDQSSTLSVTVTGPGTLTFYWSNIAEDPNQGFDYAFYVDDSFYGVQAELPYGDHPWQQVGPISILPGQHTLGWVVYANGDTDPTQAGFLDQVSFVPDTAPFITLNPFDQTNYPGYNVALLAAATAANTNTAITWQWYKVGSASPILGATSALFIPTNSGTAGVAGSYYAVASTSVGSDNTTTALVSFVSASLPPDWSAAFKSPFLPMDNYTMRSDYYYGCVTDPSGNLYVAAVFEGNTLVGSSNLNSGTGGNAAAIVKQSPAGLPLWAVAVTNNGGGSAQAYCVAPAPSGGVYLSGNYSGNNWLGTKALTDAGNGDMFLARFDANGSNIWLKTFGGANTDFSVLNSLAADPSGNVTMSGLLSGGAVSIGASNYTVVGQEGVLIQLDQTGAVRWSQLLPSGEFPQHLTYASGLLYVSVNTTTSGGTTNVVIGGVSNLTDRTWAVACLNANNGQAVWVRGVGTRSGSSQGNPYAGGITDDPPRLAASGTNLFLTGVAYDSSASFGAITVNFGDLRGQYFARYNTNGTAQVATAYGSVTTTPFAAVADAKGSLYVSGDFDTFSWFGKDLLAAPVAARPYNGLYFSQAFLAKFDLNGNPLWAREAVASANVDFSGIALATDGVWASGWCHSGYYPQIQPTLFGTNNVYSDALWLSGGPGGGTTIIWYPAGVLAKVTESAATAQPVTLLNPQSDGVNFRFRFLSQAGFNHSILYRTNLVMGNWLTNSTIAGDGTLKTNSIPLSLFSPAKQAFIRVSTQ